MNLTVLVKVKKKNNTEIPSLRKSQRKSRKELDWRNMFAQRNNFAHYT